MRAADDQFGVALVFLVTAQVAVFVSVTSMFPVHGLAIGVDLLCLSCWLAALSGWSALRPLSNKRWGLGDIVSIFALCVVMHALSAPIV